jgi:hypothetical protein
MDNMLKLMATNWGKILKLDLAQVPAGWEIDKWLHYAKVSHIAVTDSFKEGNKGSAQGKLAGLMNNNSQGVIDASQGDQIQHFVNMLEWITETMSNMVGISKQREGAIQNRETVGGVERSVLQSSHITEWLFMTHDNVKKRTLECFIETAKIAMRGQKVKFQHILSDGTAKIVDIDGEEFSECDYGLNIQDGRQTAEVKQKLEALAQSMVQNQMMSASTLVKLHTTDSLAEITRTIQQDEAQMKEQQAQAQQAEQEQFQAELEFKQQIEAEKLRIQEANNIRDNETKLLIAGINADTQANAQSIAENTPNERPYDAQKQAELEEKIRQYNSNHQLEKDKFSFEKTKIKEDQRLKEKQINKPRPTPKT